MHRGLHRTRSPVSIWHETCRYALAHRRLANDPFFRFLHDAPVDDEPVTAEEEAAVAEVERDRAAGGPTISFDDIKRALTES